ncbi:glycosyltransferase, partial [mine drainage metagenome]
MRDDADHAIIHFAGGRFDLDIPAYEPTDDLEKARAWQGGFPERMALWGTAMLARRQLIEKIGALDERIFAYWEDIDYSIRSARAGFRNVMVFDAMIFHAAKPTIATPRDVKPYYFYFMTRNEILM